MDIKSELSKNKNVLVVVSGTDYNKLVSNVVKKVAGKNVCYVTINKTFDSLMEVFKKKKVKTENIVFIDAISKSIKEAPDQSDQVYYVSSPGALTELSLVISKFLKHGFDYLIFDSVTNLSIYNKTPVCVKFLTNLINKAKQGKTKTILYAIESKDDKISDHVSGLVDKVIKA